jgi:hypothetical protein
MNCLKHNDTEASYYCSNCGVALCQECVRQEGQRILCEKCLPAVAEKAGNPVPPPPPFPPAPEPPRAASAPEKGDPYCAPGVAFALGLIPGVGAIANGELIKGFVHVVIFGSLISLAGSDQVGDLGPLFGIISGAFYIYMPLEAYHSAKKRVMALRGIQVITPFEQMRFSGFWTGVLAILFGALFLVNQFVPGSIAFVLRGWPVLLILVGVYNLTRYFGIDLSKRRA